MEQVYRLLPGGGINGLNQIIGELLNGCKKRLIKIFHINVQSFGVNVVKGIVTFFLVDFAWIFFRAERFKDAIKTIKAIFSTWNPWVLFDGSLYQCGLDEKNFWLGVVCIMILFLADVCKKKQISIIEFIKKQDYWFRWLFYSITISFIALFGIWGSGYDSAGFIYFQF